MKVYRAACWAAALAALSWTLPWTLPWTLGCGSSGNGSTSGGDGGRDAVSSTMADATQDGPGGVLVISNLVITPNPKSILSATLSFTTNVPTTASVQVTNTSDGGASNSFTIGPTTAPTTTYSLMVLGMRAQSSFVLTVTAKDSASHVAMATTTFTTGSLPSFIPPIKVVTNDPTKTSPGFTLLSIWQWDGVISNLDPAFSPLVALDAEGQVVWYYLDTTATGADAPNCPKKLANGDLVYLIGEDGWAEIDMMGNTVRSYTAASMGLDTVHHEISPELSSDYLSLSTELRKISGYPTADGGTATYPIVGDVIAEFNPGDGGVLNRWHAFDILNPMREGAVNAFNFPFWNGRYADAGSTKDWSHGNGVFPDNRDGTIVFSSRTQSWIVKFNRNDGGTASVVWRLGAGGDFMLTNANETFQYGQHGVNLLSNGHLMMFDNGNNRPAADGGVNLFSRALEYSLDTTAMTATIVWQYAESPPIFSQFIGSSFLLDNGDVLLCYGGLVDDLSLPLENPKSLKYARVMEVTHDASPTKVLEYEVRAELNSKPSTPTFAGYSVYRATRLTSLY
jgi:hypothetical protein